jgi:hypothetical protein
LVSEEGCEINFGRTGTVGYTESIDTYVYLRFDDTGEAWRFATFEEMYNTVNNGGLFAWDDNAPTDSKFSGIRSSASSLVLSAAAVSSALMLLY